MNVTSLKQSSNKLKNSLFKCKSLIQHRLFTYNFSTTSPTQTQEKTSEQIKIESLMSQWPECVRNPGKYELDLQKLKEELEVFYKFYNPDKSMLYDWEIPNEIRMRTGYPRLGALTGYSFQRVLEMFKGFLETDFIFERFNYIASRNDVEKEFYQIVIPILKSYMLKMDKQAVGELCNAALGAAKLNLGDKEFWGILEQKLGNEKIYKYLSLEQSVNLAFELNKSEKGSSSLLKVLEINIIKHRKALHLNRSLLKKAVNAYSFKNRLGSEILKAALEDPEIEVPGVDIEIPKMIKKEHEKQVYEKRRLLH